MDRWKEDVALADGKKIKVSFKDHGHNFEVCSGKLKNHMFASMSRAREAVSEAESVK